MKPFLFIVALATLSSHRVRSQNCSEPKKGTVDGDVIIGVLFPFHSSIDGRCSDQIPNPDSIQVLEAAKFAISRSNERYPTLTVGLDAWDSCYSGDVATDRSLRYLGDKVKLSYSQGDVCPNRRLYIGMVADETSVTSRAVASLSGDAHTPQISYGGTAPDLSDKEKYPYFLRTVPADQYQAQAMVDIMKRLGWVYVNVIYTKEDDHQRALQALKDIAGDHGICFASELGIKQGTTVTAAFESFLQDFSSKPNAKAVVAFVTQTHAEHLLMAAERSQRSDWQWLFSYEGMTDPSGLVRQAPRASRGILGILPATFANQVDAYGSYFQSLTPENASVASNPWFSEFWQEKYQCNLPGSSRFPSACNQAAVDSHQQNYLQYPYVSPTLNAVDALMKLVQDLHRTKCGIDSPGVCDDMLHTDPDEISQTLMQVTLAAENNGEAINFDENGDVEPIYDIANYNGTFFSLIGNWTSGVLHLNVDQVTMWVDDVPKSGSDLPVSVCGTPCTDSNCGSPEEKKVYLSGDIILGGVFPIHGKGSGDSECGALNPEGVLQLEAMLYALERINQDIDVLPNVQLGMESIDSCLSSDVASSLTLKFLSTADFGSSGSGRRVGVETGDAEHIFGVVGGADDDVCKAVSQVLKVYMVPEISYGASMSALSNPWNYPNFLRTVPPDTRQIAAIIQVMARIGWTYIQAVHTDSTCGWDGTSVLRQQAPPAGICLTQYLVVRSPISDENIDEVLAKLAKRPNAKGVVVIGSRDLVIALLRGIKRNNMEGKFYLVGSEGWGQESLPDDLAELALGAVTVSQTQRQPDRFVSSVTSLTPQTNDRNPWFDDFWMEKFQCVLHGQSANCPDSDRLKAEDIPLNTVANVIDAVSAFAYTLNELHADNCYQSDKVCDSLSDVTGENVIDTLKRKRFPSLAGDGKTVSFNYQGDDNGYFDIFNYVRDGNKYEYIKVGTYDMTAQLQMAIDITFYKTDGDAMASPPTSDCVGPCDDCKTVERAKVAEISGGDIWIGGLFEIRKPGETLIDCTDDLVMYNMQLLEAFFFAVDQVNADNATLPDVKLGAIAFDTCGLVERGVRETTNFVTGGVEYRSGYPPARVRVSGVIGGSTSDVSLEVAQVLTSLQVSQISYGATSETLGDRDDFPFFARTVPSDGDQAAALADVMSALVWRYVSVVYTKNEYGRDMLEEFVAAVKDRDVCIATSLSLEPDASDEEFGSVVDSLQSQLQAKVVVLFTSDIQTGNLLLSAERKGLTDVQWFGTETWGDRPAVVENATSTSRGAITLQFKRNPSDEFKEYFTALQAYSNPRNPWWSQWWMHHFRCNLNVWGVEKPFDVPCPWNQGLSEGFVEEADVGYVTNAVWAFAKGMHAAILELCPNKTNHLCPEVVQNPEILNARIREARFKGHGGVDFSFDDIGNGPAEYDILNLQVLNGTTQYVKVGEWSSSVMNLTAEQIKSYDADGNAVRLPTSRCIGRCLECHRLSAESPKSAELSGRLQIAGLFSVHERGDHRVECGEVREDGIAYAEAMMYAIDSINDDPAVLPGVTLGATVFDTCSSTTRAVRELSGFLSGAHFTDVNSPPSTSLPVIVGVVAAENNKDAATLVQTADEYKYTLVSYGAMTSLLSNQDVYPFFLRTVPSDENLADVLIDAISHFGWSYVSVVRSDDMYKKAEMELFMRKATESQICLATVVEMGPMIGVPAAVEKLSEFGDTGVVVLFTHPTDTRNIVQQSASGAKRHLWVFTSDVTQPSFWQGGVLPPRGGLSILLSSATDLQQYFGRLKPEANERNPWFAEYWQDKFNCSLPGENSHSENCSQSLKMSTPNYPLVGHVVSAVNAVARGVHDLLTSKCGQQGMCSQFIASTPEEFLESVKSVAFSGSDGLFKFTDGHGPAKYEIWSISDTVSTKVGSWGEGSLSIPSQPTALPAVPSLPDVDCNAVDCPVCVRQLLPPSSTVATINTRGNPQPPVTGMPAVTTRPEPQPGATTKAGNTRKPPAPVIGRTFSLDGENDVWAIIVLCLTVLGVVSSVGVLVFFLLKLKHPVVRESSSSLNIVLLLGIVFLYLLSLAFVAEESAVSCGIRRFGLGFFYAMCFAALFVKIVRIYRIGKYERRISGPKPKYISAMSQTIFYGGVMLSELLLVVEWLIVDPADVVVKGDNFVCRQTTGAFIASLLYVYLLIAVTTVIAFLARRCHDIFHEALYILICCIGSILTIVTWALVATLGPDGYEDQAICFGTLLNASLILALMFAPKIKLIVTKHEFFDNASMTSGITVQDGQTAGAFQNPTYSVYGAAEKEYSEVHKEEAQDSIDSFTADPEHIDAHVTEHSTTAL